MSFTTMLDVRADELQESDWPVSLAGYRPIERIHKHPRKRQVIIYVGGDKYTLHPMDIVGRVRRPVMASMQFLRTFDPSDSQVR